jgi:hypothetical protein
MEKKKKKSYRSTGRFAALKPRNPWLSPEPRGGGGHRLVLGVALDSRDKGQSGRWKRAEIRNGMVIIERGQTIVSCRWWGTATGEDQCQSGLVASCFILLQAKNTYTPRHGAE